MTPTEAEIRAAQQARIDRFPRDSGEIELEEAIDKFFHLIDYSAESDAVTGELITLGDDIWTDLRPSEARDLQACVARQHEKAMVEALKVIKEAVVEAAVVFAEMHPEAHRADKRQPIPA